MDKCTLISLVLCHRFGWFLRCKGVLAPMANIRRCWWPHWPPTKKEATLLALHKHPFDKNSRFFSQAFLGANSLQWGCRLSRRHKRTKEALYHGHASWECFLLLWLSGELISEPKVGWRNALTGTCLHDVSDILLETWNSHFLGDSLHTCLLKKILPAIASVATVFTEFSQGNLLKRLLLIAGSQVSSDQMNHEDQTMIAMAERGGFKVLKFRFLSGALGHAPFFRCKMLLSLKGSLT